MSSDPPLPRPDTWIPATFRALLAGAPDAMLIVDQQGRIVLANNQAAQLLGYGDGQLEGEKVEIPVPAGFRAKHSGHRAGFSEPRTRAIGVGLDLTGLPKERLGGRIRVETSTTGPTGTCFTITLPSPQAETTRSPEHGHKLA